MVYSSGFVIIIPDKTTTNVISWHQMDTHVALDTRLVFPSFLAGYWRNGWLAIVSVRLQVSVRCLSVCQACVRVCLSADSLASGFKMKKASVMNSSPSESLNILVSRNIWLITKLERGHPERGRFLRLGWVRTGNFCDFSTNKPSYLRNGAR